MDSLLRLFVQHFQIKSIVTLSVRAVELGAAQPELRIEYPGQNIFWYSSAFTPLPEIVASAGAGGG